MTKLKEKALRQFGDQGADTLDRYFAQIQYTAYWCIRMLRSSEGIEAVIPEGGEDLVLKRRGIYELHQIKTRDESQGPWRITEVLSVLCQQYHRRIIFLSNCHFHFVSNQIADNKTQKPGSLWRLKHLLEIKHSEQIYQPTEQEELDRFESELIPFIQNIMLSSYGEDLDNDTVIALLHNTWIETECRMVRTPDNVKELDAALEELHPGVPPHTVPQLQNILDGLTMMIVKKIIKTTSIAERHILKDDVLDCRSTILNILQNDYPDLNQIPGHTILDKKAWLGGFNPTEMPRFHRHKVLAENFTRRYSSLSMEDELERLVDALLECQGECRDIVCRVNGMQKDPGPLILRMVKQRLAQLRTAYSPPTENIDDMICMGLIWRETDKCYAWWSSLNNSA
ncbi:MAG TPA: hypothetical protein VEP90_16745 [Methylomirabilota bacterium]|nr:hypothetical protein [Methylomirabilota bacterium]